MENVTGWFQQNSALTLQVFLGTRMQCAQCHNHPTEKWKQSDFYKLASLANSRTRQGGREDPLLKALDEARKAEEVAISDTVRNAFNANIGDPLTRRASFQDANVRLPHDYGYTDFTAHSECRCPIKRL